jgi:hypothetical protein
MLVRDAQVPQARSALHFFNIDPADLEALWQNVTFFIVASKTFDCRDPG